MIGTKKTVTKPSSSVSRARRPKRKRSRHAACSSSTSTTTSSDEEDLPLCVDERTESGLRHSAARNNLTADMVKTILKKVCHNDHVLALVKLKEEELNRSSEHERTLNETNPDDDGGDGVEDVEHMKGNVTNTTAWTDLDMDADEDDEEDLHTSQHSPFKLTRAKARALNKKPLPILPLPPSVVHQPPPEIASIITADLRSDDEEDDEEYKPGDDEVLSDEDFNITASDLESQPPTPASLWDATSLGSPPPTTSSHHVQMSSDGQFKIPSRVQSRADSRANREHSADYIIAQQTRSKVSLATTPIEIIEANFQPPDVDHMDYGTCSITAEYMQFLTDTISADKPISVEEDDADDDEDFQLPCSNTPFADREEMYNRPIPQQECLDLFDDLLDNIDSTNMNSHPELQTLIRQLDEPIDEVVQHVDHIAAPPEEPDVEPTAIETVVAVVGVVPQPNQRAHNWKTHRANRLYRHLATEPPPDEYDFEPGGGFLSWQLALLEQQLRVHVQLSAQNYLQVYGHPGNEVWKYANTFSGFLVELDEHFGGVTVRRRIANLRPALNLVRDWEKMRSVDNNKNRGFVRYLEHHTSESKRLALACRSHFFFFHPLVSDQMLSRRGVFVYAHLLPPGPFRMDRRGNYHNVMPQEDFRIALGLERFYRQLREATAAKGSHSKRNKDSDVPLKSVCSRIETEMMPRRRSHTEQFYKYVVKRRNLREGVMNPIQYYFKHNKAPGVKHNLHQFDMDVDMEPLGQRDRQQLSKEWAATADTLAVKRTKLQSATTSQRNPSPAPPSPPSAPQHVPAALQVTCANCSHISSLDTSILFDTPHDQITTQTIQSATGPIVVTTIVCAPPPPASAADLDLSASAVLGWPPPRGSPLRATLHRRGVGAFADLLGRFLNPVRLESALLQQRHPLLRRVYVQLLSLDVYVRLWRMADSVVEMTAADSASPERDAAQSGAAKKLPGGKQPTAIPTYRVLRTADTPDELNERDQLFAQNFLDRIEAIYSPSATASTSESAATSSGAGPDRYADFLRLLTTFDARTTTAIELYARCESFFLPDHPELAELFVAFLLPADARRLGRFVEHSIMQSMSHFVDKLTAYFGKQPAQLRKILSALRDLAEEPDVGALTVERIRAKIVPMLRGNALLIEWFQQCFASDSMGVAESAVNGGSGEYETVAVPKSGAEYFAAMASSETDEGGGGNSVGAAGGDSFEEIAAADLLPDPVDHPCHIRYMNRHIFYGNKIVLPVQLSFQTVQYSSVVPTAAADSDEPGVDDGTVAGEDVVYGCVHEIKRTGDRKLATMFAGPEEASGEVVATTATTSAAIDASGADQMSASDDGGATTLELQSPVADMCCNDVLLRAHAVRLNPTLHATQQRKPNDMLEMLRRPAAGGPAVNTVTERSGSPKKRTHTGLEPAAVNQTTSTVTATVTSPSKRCKLKRQKVRKASGATSKGLNADAGAQAIDLIDIKPDVYDDDEDLDEEVLDIKSEGELWSREEDKIVLEQIKCGFGSGEELVQALLAAGQLPNRTAGEIYDRFTFLMDIIANL